MRLSALSLDCQLAGGTGAGEYGRGAGARRFRAAAAIPMFAVPASIATKATAWDNASQVRKGDHPRPLVLQGGGSTA